MSEYLIMTCVECGRTQRISLGESCVECGRGEWAKPRLGRTAK